MRRDNCPSCNGNPGGCQALPQLAPTITRGEPDVGAFSRYRNHLGGKGIAAQLGPGSCDFKGEASWVNHSDSSRLPVSQSGGWSTSGKIRLQQALEDALGRSLHRHGARYTELEAVDGQERSFHVRRQLKDTEIGEQSELIVDKDSHWSITRCSAESCLMVSCSAASAASNDSKAA